LVDNAVGCGYFVVNYNYPILACDAILKEAAKGIFYKKWRNVVLIIVKLRTTTKKLVIYC